MNPIELLQAVNEAFPIETPPEGGQRLPKHAFTLDDTGKRGLLIVVNEERPNELFFRFVIEESDLEKTPSEMIAFLKGYFAHLPRPENNDAIREHIARACHEVNRAYCLLLGDFSQGPWTEAPEWQKVSAMKGVDGALRGNDPRASHASWMQEKERTGWKYGPVKDEEKKEHPCMVPYDSLPAEQQKKDFLFVSTVRMFKAALSG